MGVLDALMAGLGVAGVLLILLGRRLARHAPLNPIKQMFSHLA